MIFLIVVIGFGFIYLSPTGSGPSFDLPFLPQPSKIKSIDINGVIIKAEIADNKDKRTKGLSDRISLATDSGMLFVYPEPDKYIFWMKGVKFPLDFIWISGDKIVDIFENVQPPIEGQKDSDLPVYSSPQMVDKVLELNAGVAQKLNLKVGDIIKLSP